MKCVVCRGELPEGTLFWANSYEKIRKLYPCCSDACAADFKSDVHWFPAERPTRAPEEDEVSLTEVAKHRIRGGDDAHVIVRELLVLGVAPRMVRNALNDSLGAISHDGRSEMSVVGGSSILSIVLDLFRRNKRLKPVESAYDNVDRWERHYGVEVKPALRAP